MNNPIIDVKTAFILGQSRPNRETIQKILQLQKEYQENNSDKECIDYILKRLELENNQAPSFFDLAISTEEEVSVVPNSNEFKEYLENSIRKSKIDEANAISSASKTFINL